MIGCDARPGNLLIALYVGIGDRVLPSGRRGWGWPKNFPTPSWSAWPWREYCWAPTWSITGCAWAMRGWGAYSPYLPMQPGYHKQLKAAAPLLAAATGHLARQAP